MSIMRLLRLQHLGTHVMCLCAVPRGLPPVPQSENPGSSMMADPLPPSHFNKLSWSQDSEQSGVNISVFFPFDNYFCIPSPHSKRTWDTSVFLSEFYFEGSENLVFMRNKSEKNPTFIG